MYYYLLIGIENWIRSHGDVNKENKTSKHLSSVY